MTTQLKPVETHTPTPPKLSPGAMLFEPGNLERFEHFAGIMAKSRSMVPAHLRGNLSDCMAIIMQAAQWGIDPFAVAGKTYQVQPGAPVGYEGQLVNAVIIANAPIIGRPDYEFFGEWGRVQGKLKILENQKGGKYAIPNWSEQDEEGVGVTVIVHIRGEANPKRLEVLLKQCWPRNSTNWANDPQQQICYAAIRKIARRHFPDVIMGVYTREELEYQQPEEKDITPASVEDLLDGNHDTQPTDAERIAGYRSDIFQAPDMGALKTIGNRMKKEGDSIKGALRQVYADKLATLRPKPEHTDDDAHSAKTASTIDPAQIQKIIETADSRETLEEAKEMVEGLDKRTKEYAELRNMIGVRMGEFEGTDQ